MKRGANTRNQDTEAGSRYPSILRTNSTEKTVKLNRVGEDYKHISLLVSVFNLSPDETDPNLKETDAEPPQQLLLSEQHGDTQGSGMINCRLLLKFCYRNMKAADDPTLNLCIMFILKSLSPRNSVNQTCSQVSVSPSQEWL